MRIFLLVGVVLFAYDGFAQGCSDAGFCTMGAMKPDQPYNKRLKIKLRSIEFSQYFGHTHFNNKIWVSTIEANIGLGNKYIVQAKVPYQIAHGKLGTYQSLSDLSFSLTRNVISKDAFDVNVTVGTKIPTNNSDLAHYHDKSLPMYYQTSLGSYDVIVGASIISRKWLFAAGYQQAITANKNGFWWGEWSDEPADIQKYILQYAQSNLLLRGKDIMLRVERNFRFSRFNASIGLLPIWRVTKDYIQVPVTADPSILTPTYVKGSTGLALSGIYTVGYNFNVRSGVKLLIGTRLIQREKNPDGLSREEVVSATYSYHF